MPSRDAPRLQHGATDIAAQGWPAPAHPTKPSVRFVLGGVVKTHPKWRPPMQQPRAPVRCGFALEQLHSRDPQEVVEEHTPDQVWQPAARSPLGSESKKARNLAVSGPPRRELGRVRLRATSTRLQLVFIRIGLQSARQDSRIAQARKVHGLKPKVAAGRDAHERPTRCESKVDDGQCGAHDGSSYGEGGRGRWCSLGREASECE